jgi:hypothetical protein
MIGKEFIMTHLELNLPESRGMARKIFLKKQLDLPHRGTYSISETIVSTG